MTEVERKKKQKKASNKRYLRTVDGFLTKRYCDMVNRTRGKSTSNPTLYVGLPVMSKDELIIWAKNSPKFCILFIEWEKSNYKRKLSPSVDRVDPSKGYTADNVRWLTFSENASYVHD